MWEGKAMINLESKPKQIFFPLNDNDIKEEINDLRNRLDYLENKYYEISNWKACVDNELTEIRNKIEN